MVLIPGCGGDHTAFDPLLPHLGGLDAQVLPLPGRSNIPGPAPGTVAESAAFVADWARRQAHRRHIFAGHSYGGGIAIELALTHPDVVAGIVLMDTGARLKAHQSILDEAEAQAARDPSREANLRDWRACHAFDRLRDIGRIDCPTLVICGEEDPLTPVRYARYLADGVAGAHLVLIPGAGHYAPVSHPEQVGKEIIAFALKLSS